LANSTVRLGVAANVAVSHNAAYVQTRSRPIILSGHQLTVLTLSAFAFVVLEDGVSLWISVTIGAMIFQKSRMKRR
jgi:type IV secretory pathway TrbD component